MVESALGLRLEGAQVGTPFALLRSMEKLSRASFASVFVLICLVFSLAAPPAQAFGIGETLATAKFNRMNAEKLKKRREIEASKKPGQKKPATSVAGYLSEYLMKSSQQLTQWGEQAYAYVTNSESKADVTVKAKPASNHRVQVSARAGSL